MERPLQDVLFEAHLLIPLIAEKQHFPHHSLQERSMCLNQCVQVSSPLVREVHQGRPRALDDLQLVESLELSQEMHHLRLHNSTMVPIIVETCSSALGSSRTSMHFPAQDKMQQLTRYPLKQLRAANHPHPPRSQNDLHPLYLEQMVEQTIVLNHRSTIQYGIKRSLHLVLQREAVPAQLPMRKVQYPRIESA